MQAHPVNSLTLQFLAWVSAAPRSYGEAMEAWRTTCPRMTVWEDAVSDGLIRLEANGPMKDAKVSLTAHGRSLVEAKASTSRAEPAELEPNVTPTASPAKLKRHAGTPFQG
jgi:hypothetical protein